MSRIAVAGAGAFGTGLAIAFAQAGTPVTLWARDPEHAEEMRNRRENRARLPGCPLPDAISVSSTVSDLAQGDAILLSVPMQSLANFLETHRDILNGRCLVACCKGVDLTRGQGPAEILAAICPKATGAILTGPSFAADIARGLPTALTLACQDPDAGRRLQAALSTPNLRLYRSRDTVGAEMGGALKNVMAIAAGIVVGRGMGDSARAALITRGFAEMRRYASAFGAETETLSGLSGLGDLILTCTSEQSRNYRYGLALGRGATFDPQITVEGAPTARAVARVAAARHIEMPITAMVAAILEAKIDIAAAVDSLLARPLREE